MAITIVEKVVEARTIEDACVLVGDECRGANLPGKIWVSGAKAEQLPRDEGEIQRSEAARFAVKIIYVDLP